MLTSWRQITFFAAVSLVAGLMMISSESLWIDEGQTLHYINQPTLGAWFNELLHSIKSEAQMPLGMFVAWLGGKILGTSEWALRATNLMWVTLGGVAVALAGRRLRLPALWPLFLLSPFLWFYANEARPYTMQICAGAWLLWVLARAQDRGSLTAGDVALFGLWSFVGFGASLLFAFAVAGALAAGIVLWWQGRLRCAWSPRHWLASAIAALVLGALGLYYLDTLRRGAAGARLWTVSPLNLCFALYELLGFSGLGPPRNELRDLVRAPAQLLHYVLQPRVLLGLGSLGALSTIAAWRLWRNRREPLPRWIGTAILVSAAMLYLAAMVVKFPFWGRHLAPLLPFVVVLVAFAAQARGENGSRWSRHWLAFALAIPLLASALFLRFGPAHRKDDYRGAVQVALRALEAQRTIWWSADAEECAAYYGLTAARATALGGRFLPCYPTRPEVLTNGPPPDVIFLSKPDVHDVQGFVQEYLRRPGYVLSGRLSAFEVWVSPVAAKDPIWGQSPP